MADSCKLINPRDSYLKIWRKKSQARIPNNFKIYSRWFDIISKYSDGISTKFLFTNNFFRVCSICAGQKLWDFFIDNFFSCSEQNQLQMMKTNLTQNNSPDERMGKKDKERRRQNWIEAINCVRSKWLWRINDVWRMMF